MSGGTLWCANCEEEGDDPDYVNESACCRNPKVTSTTYLDSCSSCGYYYDYKSKKSGHR